MIDLMGRTVFISGSTQGVGRSIALACAKAGASIVLHGLTKDEQADATLADVKQFDSKASLVTGDLVGSETAAIDRIFHSAIDANPRIDLLVNNAGTFLDKPFLEMDFDAFDRTMRLNVYAYFFLTQRFAKRWVENNIGGRVLLIGSINGRLAEQTHAAYDTSKGAVEMMVKTLCVSLAPHGIRVNGLAPGLFNTPLTAKALGDDTTRQWMQLHTPNGRCPVQRSAAKRRYTF